MKRVSSAPIHCSEKVTIEIVVQKKTSLPPAQIVRIAKNILSLEKVRAARLSLAFVSDQRIRSINKKFLGHDYPTDVLAFDLRNAQGSTFSVQGASLNSNRCPLVAEIIISSDTVIRQSKEFRTTPQQELVLYLVHGILHLRGYDDHRRKDVERMRSRERKIMASLGYPIV